ncbi:MAG: hypothetical protein JWQ02_3619 [Capsulimonas sp.]|nr:hypothetical protein [Capsulimonas sp.]
MSEWTGAGRPRGKIAVVTGASMIEETAEMVIVLGGLGIAVRLDHTVDLEIENKSPAT